MPHESNLAKALIEECLSKLTMFQLGRESSALLVRTALELVPRKERGPFALSVLRRVQSLSWYEVHGPVEFEPLLFGAIAAGYMESPDPGFMKDAAEAMHDVPWRYRFVDQFDDALKEAFQHSGRDSDERLLTLISLVGKRRNPALTIAGHQFVKSGQDTLVSMAVREVGSKE